MKKIKAKIMITGGAGFIGSAFTRLAVARGFRPLVVDKLTYAGDLKRLESVKEKIIFYRQDICDSKRMENIFRKERPSLVVNFAASTHVDRSIKDASSFLRTNVLGTQVLLDCAKNYDLARFIQISTDEVYGDINKGSFSEAAKLAPNSPYSAAKAAADLLVNSYIRTFGLPAIIIRPCNNYGPWQYPEKLIPLAILKLFKNQPIPIYAKGRNIREWLYVDDCAAAILQILRKGRCGAIYNLGSGERKRNIDVARELLEKLNLPRSRVRFIQDRPGHDFRYSLDSRRLLRETGWQPKVKFSTGVKLVCDWCKANKGWLFSKYAEVSQLYGG